MESRKYKVSVIIPIYNVEKYIGETIDSVTKQTIGFKKNIQLILINDGSPDDSEKICLEYKEKYPENIVYVHQANGGVSNARNNALQYVKGELVTFLDSDDKWSLDAFKTAYNFWKNHNEVKVISCKMTFFDAKRGGHPLNYKYAKNRVVDITKDYKYIQLSSSSVFIEKDTLLKYRYDEKVKYSEDNKLINEILFDNPKMGILKKPIYYYRRRINLSSAIQNSVKSVSWYLDTPKNVYEYLYNLSISKFSKPIDYVKFLIAYDISWRVGINDYEQVLTLEQQNEYITLISDLIDKIDDKFFIEQKVLSIADKQYILSLRKSPATQMGDLGINDKDTVGLLTIDNAYIRENKLSIYGKVNTIFYNIEKLQFKVNGKKHKLEFYELKNNVDKMSFKNECISKNVGFKCVLDINKTREFEFRYDNEQIENISFGKRALFTNKLEGSYYTYGSKMLKYNNGKISITKNSFVNRLNMECKNTIGLLKDKKINILLIRWIIILTRPFYSRNIWLVSDNGEHIFKYLCDKKIKRVKPYFVISKNTTDYKRLKKYGRVVNANSLRYKLLFVHSKYILSSHAEDYIINIFGKRNKYFYDLLKFRYIFLQHGIILNDLSSWLNPNTKPIDMFVTSAKDEWESILEYGYDENIVKLTGLARYDNLIKDVKTKKQILLQPTWRNYLTSQIDNKTGERVYNPNFKESDFFKFYNSLLNNHELIDILKRNGFKIKLCPHPNLLTQIKDFEENEILEIEKGRVNYQQEFKDAAMLITDYSSVFFDVAYLNKPVIYTQFDEQEFYQGQIYDKGYFDYRKNGFGPVCTDVETTIQRIKEMLDNGFKMDKEYSSRVKNFYYNMDDKNCERIYKEIIKIK